MDTKRQPTTDTSNVPTREIGLDEVKQLRRDYWYDYRTDLDFSDEVLGAILAKVPKQETPTMQLRKNVIVMRTLTSLD